MFQKLFRSALACALAAGAAVTLGAAAHAPGRAKTAPPAAVLVKVSAPATALVKIGNFTFGPQDLTVAPGTTVTWVNDDDIPHTVAASDKSYRSKVLDTGDRFSMTFAKPGTYEYFCSIHPHMTGKVVVKAP
jgi:plastocyanin